MSGPLCSPQALAAVAAACGAAAAVAAIVAGCSASPPLIFYLHPIAGAAAFGACMTLAVGSYYGSPPSMSRGQRREWHKTLNIAAFVLVVIAAIGILGSKIAQAKSPVPHSIHGWLGICVVAGVGVQAWSGWAKHAAATAGAGKVHAWHGQLGEAVLGAGLLNMALGAALMFGWGSGWVIACAVLSAVSFACTEAALYAGRAEAVLQGKRRLEAAGAAAPTDGGPGPEGREDGVLADE